MSPSPYRSLLKEPKNRATAEQSDSRPKALKAKPQNPKHPTEPDDTLWAYKRTSPKGLCAQVAYALALQ